MNIMVTGVLRRTVVDKINDILTTCAEAILRVKGLRHRLTNISRHYNSPSWNPVTLMIIFNQGVIVVFININIIITSSLLSLPLSTQCLLSTAMH